MTDISLGDIDALAAQKLRLEQRINTLNAKMVNRAASSPKMSLKKRKNGTSTLTKEMLSSRDEDEDRNGNSNTSGRSSKKKMVHLGESCNPVIKQTSRSETTKLMRSLADSLAEI